MDTKITNRHFLDYGIWRADHPLSDEREFDFAVQYDITNIEYVESINAYPKLMAELKWAIDEGII